MDLFVYKSKMKLLTNKCKAVSSKRKGQEISFPLLKNSTMKIFLNNICMLWFYNPLFYLNKKSMKFILGQSLLHNFFLSTHKPLKSHMQSLEKFYHPVLSYFSLSLRFLWTKFSICKYNDCARSLINSVCRHIQGKQFQSSLF